MMKSVTKEKVFHVLKMILIAVTVTLVLLIYFVGNSKIVRSRLSHVPDQHICNSSTGWYVHSDSIGVQVL